jgi:hypothetical protein
MHVRANCVIVSLVMAEQSVDNSTTSATATVFNYAANVRKCGIGVMALFQMAILG